MKSQITQDLINKGFIKIILKGCDAVVYFKDNGIGKSAQIIGYKGKATKPAFNYLMSAKGAAEYVADWQKGLVYIQERKAASKQQEKDAIENHGVKAGDVFYTSWGYDQTNVDFFQVIEVKGKTATLREIAREHHETGFMCGEVVPVVGKFIDEPITKRIQACGGSIYFKISQSASARPLKYTEIAGTRVYESKYKSSYA